MNRIEWSTEAISRFLDTGVVQYCGQSSVELVAGYFGEFQPRRTGELEKNRRSDRSRREVRRVGFTGRFFDTLTESNRGSDVIPNERDLAAISCLSIRISGDMVGSLLSVRPQLEECLNGVGLDRASEIWNVEKSCFEEGAPLSKARQLVGTLAGFGETLTYKLFAAVFPHLSPVKVSWIVGLMSPSEEANWWMSWSSVATEDMRNLLEGIRSDASRLNSEVPHKMSLLRVVDVVLWNAEFTRRNR